jgi:squalene-associated FAD-dependent desaturase
VTERTVHVIGAGIAGLSAASVLASRGLRVELYEATGHAGGRCRSYHDPVLGRAIDNGTHVLVGANRAAFRYLARIGATDRLLAMGGGGVSFVDVARGQRWRARLGGGVVPWWIAVPSRRVPDSTITEYLRLRRLFNAKSSATVTDCLGAGPLMDRLWRPLTKAALNTAPEEASARLLVPVVRGMMLGGAAAARIHVARDGLGPTFVDPALALLAANGVTPRYGARLRAIDEDAGHVRRLNFDGDGVTVRPDDTVILAVPGPVAAGLVPGLQAPRSHRPIVNVHVRLPPETPEGEPLVGVLGGTAHWFHRRGDILSATVSAAVSLAEEPAEAIAAAIWRDAAAALGLAGPLPPHRVVKERLATFAQTPTEVARRPGARTRLGNLVLAGDWIDTGLPATIDGAALSGEAAALALAIASEKR